LVFKYDEQYNVQDPNAGGGNCLKNEKIVRQLGDMGVISFFKLIYEIKQSPVLTKYKHDERLTNHLNKLY